MLNICAKSHEDRSFTFDKLQWASSRTNHGTNEPTNQPTNQQRQRQYKKPSYCYYIFFNQINFLFPKATTAHRFFMDGWMNEWMNIWYDEIRIWVLLLLFILHPSSINILSILQNRYTWLIISLYYFPIRIIWVGLICILTETNREWINE